MENPVKYCTRCGTAMPAEAMRCDVCGAPVRIKPAADSILPIQKPAAAHIIQNPSTHKDSNLKRNRSSMLLRIAVAAVLIITAFGCFTVFFVSDFLYKHAKNDFLKNDIKKAEILLNISILTDFNASSKAEKLVTRGIVRLDLGKTQQALEDCSKAELISNRSYKVRIHSGSCLAEAQLMSGNTEMAFEQAEAVSTRIHHDGNALFMHAKAAERLGKWSIAVQDYNRIIGDKTALSSIAARNGDPSAIKPAQKKVLLALSETYAAHGMFKMMGLYTERILKEISPSDPDALLLQAKSKYLIGNMQTAFKLSSRIAKQTPTFVDAVYLAGITASETGNCNASKKYSNMLLSKTETRSKGLTIRGNYHLCQNNDKAALKAFHEALAVDRNNSDAALFSGEIYYKYSEFEKAIKHFKNAMVLAPQDIRPLVAATNASCWLNKPLPAQKYFKKARSIWPGDSLDSYSVINMEKDTKYFNIDSAFPFCFMQAMGPEFAVLPIEIIMEYDTRSYDQLLNAAQNYISKHKLTNKDFGYHIIVIFALLDSGRTEAAKNEFFTMISVAKPSRPSDIYAAWYFSKELSVNQGVIRKVLDKGIEQFPDDYWLYYMRGITNQRLKDYFDAISDYDKAISINPDFADAYQRRSNAKFYLKDCVKYYRDAVCNDAVADIQKAISINPEEAKYYIGLGFLKMHLRDTESTIQAFDMAIFLKPKNASYYNDKCHALEQLGKCDTAIKTCSESIRLAPRMSSAYNNRGKCFFVLNKYDSAIDDFTDAISINPNVFEFYFNRGVVYIKTKRFVEAESDMLKASLFNISDKRRYEAERLYEALRQKNGSVEEN